MLLPKQRTLLRFEIVSHCDMNELIGLSATEVVRLLKGGEVTPSELVEAAASRIEAVDIRINALPTLCIDRALDCAARIMRQDKKLERPRAWLGGLPIAVKDLNPVAGVRCTYGSPIFAEFVPESSDYLVQVLERNGAIVIGKSNTPEFGAGASTFNEVFGQTRNPWNTTRSVAGSSGGAAAALAAGEVWLATGSDLGGSLRTPASFNAVVGLRPSPGRVPIGPSLEPFDTLAVNGPMARTALDTALFLDAMSERHPRDPLSLEAPATPFVEQVKNARIPKCIGFSPDLGIIPVDPEVVRTCEQAAGAFANMGIAVEDACPDFSEAIDCFQTLRAALLAAKMADTFRAHRNLLKPELTWNIEKGLAIHGEELSQARHSRAMLYRRVVEFFDTFDLLLCPAAIVPPFEVDRRYVDEVNGVKFDNYVHWLAPTFAITLTSCPAVSVPAGFNDDGLPIGLQMVGPPRCEGAVLAAAHLLEQIVQFPRPLPIDPLADRRSA